MVSVQTASGGLAEFVELTKNETKGKLKGRRIRMHPKLRDAISEYLGGRPSTTSEFLVLPRQGQAFSANAITVFLHNLNRKTGVRGAGSHAGRRGFTTKLAREIGRTGGSLRDVCYLAGHSSLVVTARDVEHNEEAQLKLIERLRYSSWGITN